MTQNVLLSVFTVLVDLPDSVWILLGLLPLLCVILAWVLKVTLRKPETVGFAYNGRGWVKWLLLLYLLEFLFNTFVAPHLDRGSWEIKSAHSPHGILYIQLFTAYCFLCYFLVAFREVDAEQAARAKSSKALVLNFAATAAGAAAGVGAGLLQALWSGLQIVLQILNPINIIKVSGNTIWYTVGGAGQAFAGLVILIPVVVIIGMLGMIANVALFFLTAVIMWAMSILKFLLNLRVTFMGPSAVWFKTKSGGDE